jgi:CheY-like chemotaxis protein
MAVPGLGLAISKQLVELMGGHIDVASRQGQGSNFSFEIPLELTTATPADSTTLHKQLNGVRALAVDDVEMNLEIVSRQLAGLGMEIVCRGDGFEALAELERAWHRGNPYDIVLLDQMMPGLSGEKLAERIRAIPSLAETKLVLISSSVETHRKDTIKLFDAKLDKPLRQRDLLNCLARFYASDDQAVEENTAAPADTHGAGGKATEIVSETFEPIRVLMAEDNRINQIYASALLSKAGHKVVMVANGYQAVDAVRDGDYDVVLMDIQMPGLDGVQATAQIRALPAPKSKIRIIALTANAMSGAKEEYLAAGFDDYITKPINPPFLLAKLAELSARAKLATRNAA